MTKSSDILCQSIDFHQINTFSCEKKKEYNLERRETWGQESCSYKHFFFIFHKLTKSRAARKFNRGKKTWTGLLIFPPSFLNRFLINFPKKPAGKITFKKSAFPMRSSPTQSFNFSNLTEQWTSAIHSVF